MNINYLSRINIVLVEPQGPLNIGAVARVMKNTGLRRLYLVNPRTSLDEDAYKMASHSEDILKNSKVVSSLQDALRQTNYVFGTTSRKRRYKKFITPKEMAEKIMPLLKNNKIALVFGPEDRGLTNKELDLCDEIVCIPTIDPSLSLNLAQAAMVLCYEIFVSFSDKKISKRPFSQVATLGEKEAMYRHIEDVLKEIGFIHVPDASLVINRFRKLFSQTTLLKEDVQLIRGLCRQLLWYLDYLKRKPK